VENVVYALYSRIKNKVSIKYKVFLNIHQQGPKIDIKNTKLIDFNRKPQEKNYFHNKKFKKLAHSEGPNFQPLCVKNMQNNLIQNLRKTFFNLL
jgi:hypothetical protein